MYQLFTLSSPPLPLSLRRFWLAALRVSQFLLFSHATLLPQKPLPNPLSESWEMSNNNKVQEALVSSNCLPRAYRSAPTTCASWAMHPQGSSQLILFHTFPIWLLAQETKPLSIKLLWCIFKVYCTTTGGTFFSKWNQQLLSEAWLPAKVTGSTSVSFVLAYSTFFSRCFTHLSLQVQFLCCPLHPRQRSHNSSHQGTFSASLCAASNLFGVALVILVQVLREKSPKQRTPLPLLFCSLDCY